MRIVPLNWKVYESTPIIAGVSLITADIAVLSQQTNVLCPPRLEPVRRIANSKREEVKSASKDKKPDKPEVQAKQMLAFLEGLGFEPLMVGNELRVPTSYPGVELVIKPAGQVLQAQLQTKDGQVQAEMSRVEKPDDILAFLHENRVTTPKPMQKDETAVRRPVERKDLVDMGI